MPRSVLLRVFGVAILAACVGACVAPVETSPTPPSSSTPPPPPLLEETPPPVEPPTAPAEDIRSVANNGNEFGLDLYKRLAKNTKENLIVSPYSISSALAMTYAGARGQTAAEMARTMRFALPPERLHPAVGATTHKLQSADADGQRLNIANSLWGQSGVKFSPDFLNLTRKNYGAGFRELDFQANPESARGTINGWVSDKTNKMIPELIRKGEINEGTRLVLTNAIYFRGLWDTPFEKKNTKDDKFKLTATETVPVKMMNSYVSLWYSETKDYQVVVLPYKNKYRSMIVVVPRAVDGVAAVEQTFTPADVKSWYANGTTAIVRLALPVFKAGFRDNLGPMLQAMGMKSAFERGADFSGLGVDFEFYLSVVLHEAVVEVNEEGTKAAAATAVVGVTPVSAQIIPKEVVVRADHPFLFMIYDSATENILFVGRFAKP